MKVLYTAFKGAMNSSKVLLDEIENNHKLYITNSFETSVKELYKEIENYDYIISFGQAPLEQNVIKIEMTGCGENSYDTNYDYLKLKAEIEALGFKVILSKDAGNYLCNNFYYHELQYIDEHNLTTKMIFIHVPSLKNFSQISLFAHFISNLKEAIYE